MLDLESTLHMFRCPETGRPVDRLEESRLGQLNTTIQRGDAQTVDGEAVDRPLDAGLHPRDTDFVYPVRDGIPDFTAESRIAVSDHPQARLRRRPRQ